MSPAQTPPVATFLKKMLWWLFLLVVLGLCLDVALGYRQSLARGLALGAVLAFFAQSIFTLLSQRGKRSHQGKQIDTRPAKVMLSDMTQGLIGKWVVVVLGFALIFNLPYVIFAPAVFVGFVLMQVGVVVLLWQHKKV